MTPSHREGNPTVFGAVEQILYIRFQASLPISQHNT
jgi:hypothetical protein